MRRRILFSFLILLTSITTLSAQTTLKTLKISTKDFSKTPGTPRIVRNAFDHEWLVAWRQQGSPSKILGRVIESNGTLRAKKTLASKVSTAPQSFDIFFDAVNYNYLLAYENAAGINVQLFNSGLSKSGPARKIEGGVSGTLARLAFDISSEKFLLFWVSDGGKALKSVALNSDGSISGSIRTLKQAAGNSTYRSLNISTNQDTGNLIALITESNGSTAKLLGLRLKPDGSLQKQTPLSVTPSDADLNSIFADSSFSDSGTGIAFWSDGDSLKQRKLSRSNGLASGAKSIAGQADANSAQTSILFDARSNQFVPVWTVGNDVRAMALSTSGTVKQNPFDVATSNFANALNATTSYDGQSGNAIVVWEDSTQDANAIALGTNATFRIRGAIFFFESAGVKRSISIGDNFYSPQNLNINVGDTVEWVNNGGVAHTVTSGSPSNAGQVFDSGNLGRGALFSFRFNTAGSFPYFCRIHGSTMSGTITVQASGGEPNPRY